MTWRLKFSTVKCSYFFVTAVNINEKNGHISYWQKRDDVIIEQVLHRSECEK